MWPAGSHAWKWGAELSRNRLQDLGIQYSTSATSPRSTLSTTATGGAAGWSSSDLVAQNSNTMPERARPSR